MERNEETDGRRGGAPRLALALLALLGVAAGCAPPQAGELSGPFGPGSGGPPLSGATAPVAFARSDGVVYGEAAFDPAYFQPLPAATPDQPATLAAPAAGIVLAYSRIAGRPDTPCRYQAALLARDQHFTIAASGERSNDRGLSFYQVNLQAGGVFRRLYCVRIAGELGVAIVAQADAPEKLEYVQVLFVLNSVRPR
jgi:hypothetical protein